MVKRMKAGHFSAEEKGQLSSPQMTLWEKIKLGGEPVVRKLFAEMQRHESALGQYLAPHESEIGSAEKAEKRKVDESYALTEEDEYNSYIILYNVM